MEPVILWQEVLCGKLADDLPLPRKTYRVVMAERALVVECQHRDALGAEAWIRVESEGENANVLSAVIHSRVIQAALIDIAHGYAVRARKRT